MKTRKLSGEAPRIVLPEGSIDCHMHVYGNDFPSQPGGPDSPADYADLSMYRQVQEWLGIDRVVVVQANAHQKDNRCILNALAAMGGAARGVAVVPPDVKDIELALLHEQGIRGARIMELPGGAVGLKDLLEVNAKVSELGWHNIVQFDGCEMVERKPLLEKIKGNYVIDHFAKFLSPTIPNDPSFKALLELIDRGNCYVKFAGCYESSHTGDPYYRDVAALARALVAHAPERIIWGSNWPHVSLPVGEARSDAKLLDVVCRWIPDQNTLEKVFVQTPARLYDF